ncbi:hypothetical protein [Peptostreptococcus faecalis]|uniref:hypothetical protein n=1 Tax=Peptostreptococcus faecalis TaxID=2045015 RepID=UPI000C7A4F5C|nr:hypothetical protein [Peptostreptococcus faecalis]
MSTKKKKEKPYYNKNFDKKVDKKEKDLTKNTTFMLGIGFLLFIYSNYIKMPIYSRVLAIFGLSVMMYGIVVSIKMKIEKNKDEGTKPTLDYAMGGLVACVIIYNLILLVMQLV